MTEAMAGKDRAPAIEGWFTVDDDPRLIGGRCRKCGSYFFPRESFFCRNPLCNGREFEEVELGRRGTLWSYTDAQYQPPPPYIPRTDPYEPFAIAAVELAEEKVVILGQVAGGITVEELEVGRGMVMDVAPLYEDDEHEYLTWVWRIDNG